MWQPINTGKHRRPTPGAFGNTIRRKDLLRRDLLINRIVVTRGFQDWRLPQLQKSKKTGELHPFHRLGLRGLRY